MEEAFISGKMDQNIKVIIFRIKNKAWELFITALVKNTGDLGRMASKKGKEKCNLAMDKH